MVVYYKGDKMLVLKILGVLFVIYLLFEIVRIIDEFTVKRYRYIFFNKQTFISSSIGYACAVVGYIWYTNALEGHGDVLNGKLLMIISALFLFWVILKNITSTGFFIGIVLTPVQQAIYLTLAAGGVLLVLLLSLAYADAKPVYRIDD